MTKTEGYRSCFGHLLVTDGPYQGRVFPQVGETLPSSPWLSPGSLPGGKPSPRVPLPAEEGHEAILEVGFIGPPRPGGRRANVVPAGGDTIAVSLRINHASRSVTANLFTACMARDIS